MISRSSITGRSLQAARRSIDGRRFSLGQALAPRIPRRSLWVVQSGGHVFAKFSEQECDDWKTPAEIHFGAGAEYQDKDGRSRLRGRLRKQKEQWVETASVHVGDIDTIEKATLVKCMIGIVEQSDYDPDRFNCINATDTLVATLRQQPPLAPEGTNMSGCADEYMRNLGGLDDSPPAGELSFHLPER